MKAVLDASVLVRAVIAGATPSRGSSRLTPDRYRFACTGAALFEAVTDIRHLEAHRAIEAKVADGVLAAADRSRLGARGFSLALALVEATPPLIACGLRPALGRIFPGPLPANGVRSRRSKRCQAIRHPARR